MVNHHYALAVWSQGPQSLGSFQGQAHNCKSAPPSQLQFSRLGLGFHFQGFPELTFALRLNLGLCTLPLV